MVRRQVTITPGMVVVGPWDETFLPIVTRDRDGDGKGDLILYRPTTSTFWAMPSNADLTYTRLEEIRLGRPEDAPF